MGMEDNKKHKVVSDKNNTFFTGNRITTGTCIPTEGTYNTGDVIVNNGPTAATEPMWICNEGGTPGKWGPMLSTNTTIVNSYSGMMRRKSAVGNLYYVISDELWDGEPGFYIVLSVRTDEEGIEVPDEVYRINKKENNIPKLSYDSSLPEGSKLYLKEDEDLILSFNFESNTYGDGKYRVYRDGVLIRSFNSAKGRVIANLGPIPVEGTFTITVTATDYLTIPAPETLSYTVVVGGLKLSSTFEETLATAIFEEGDRIGFPYSMTVSDTNAVVKVDLKLLDGENRVVEKETVELLGTSVHALWNTSAIESRGAYTIEAQAYSGESLEDTTEGTFVSNKLSYSFRVLQVNEIAIVSELNTNTIDNNTFLSLPFKIISRIANYFIMKGEVIKINADGTEEVIKSTSETGLPTAVNIRNYWSVGKLEIGEYKFILRAYTVDGGVESLESAQGRITVTESTYQRVEPIKDNLVAWFDANNMRNNDERPDVWVNSKGLDDSYKILLHDLNYTSNGWVHVDETLSDSEDGEMMLKFTGDSYGELVKFEGNDYVRYNPFSIFSNSGQPGITIETAIRTRCVGERNSRVMTCMEGAAFDATGVAISFDSVALGSNSRVNKLDFIEDEWVHITMVVDNNIRNMGDIGQEMIEDLNQTKSMRIYMNGVLCSCNAFTDDKFLDAANKAYPLILNAALDRDEFINFGECEIKFIRIYNSFLKSSEVLNNYIAHIYEQEEQMKMVERNDVNIATLPTIVFRRNTTSNNKTTFGVLNSITDKKESKKTCVDCVMEFDDGDGNITVYENVDVYLQGTSSLQYPVKNYKIKCYNDVERTSKNKIILPGKETEWVEDYTYTLKCDYMEQSHMNNTPTARFFDQIVTYLGGESPARKEGYRDSIDGFPCIVYYNDGAENVLVGSFMFNIDKSGAELGFECDLYDEHGNIIGNGKNSCVSYEGTANASDTAGCFFKLEESINNVYQYYIENEYKEYLKESGLTSDRYSIDDFRRDIYDGLHEHVMSFDEFVADYDETDYIMADFEARYSFNEDDEKATYKPMIDLVNWVSDSIKAGTFKKDFEAHLDLKYMLAYYLQMMVFTQVDNCGKNCMWDTWDGVKFYPRPYDMDTSMGLSNTGTETIRVDAELLPELSPFEVEGGTHSGYYNNDTTTDLRYLSFNTKTSKLWNAFTEEFQTEIKDAYRNLRNAGIFSFNNIVKNAFSITCDMIGEIYYNKDAASKYLSQTTDKTTEYLKMLHGNRTQKYKKFLKERIIFLDTIYDYMESKEQVDSLNSIITLRSDALYGQTTTKTIQGFLGISSYSPQYVTISVGSGQDAIVTAYVGPESTYVDPDTGIECEGTLFSFPIRGTDKEIIISGAGNIKDLAKIQQLNVRDLTIDKAERILNLDLSYSSRMTILTMGNNKYLRTLNCSNSYLLGTGDNGQTIDLSKCVNLREVDLSYTKVTGVNISANNILKKINLGSSSIKNVEIDGAEFLTEIDITNCTNMNMFKLDRCAKITSVNVAGSTIRDFMVTNCENVTEIDVSNCKSIVNFDVTNSYNIERLNMTGNTSEVMHDLHLYSMYNLKELIVSKTTTAYNIRLPKYLNAVEASKAMNGEDALLWDTLEVLDLSSSSVKKIQYGSADIEGDVVDMKQLRNLTTLKFYEASDMVEIKDLYYVGDLTSLFAYCKNLVKISGYISNTTSSGKSLFASCYRLSNINDLNFDFKNLASLELAFDRCFRINTPSAKKVLDAAGSSLTNVTHLFHMASMDGLSCILGTSSDTTTTIPSNFFDKNPNITNVSYAFDITGYKTVPGNLFDKFADKLATANYVFTRMPNLTTVGVGIFRNKPKLTNVISAFASSGNLTNYIDNDPNIFEGSPNISSTEHMFYSCGKLVLGDKGFGQMLYPLVNLTSCAHMFYGCAAMAAPIPEGFLSKNTRLKKITGLFQRCRKLTRLPESIFRESIIDTVSFPNLTAAASVFAECNALEGEVSARFFVGAEKITDLSWSTSDTVPWSNTAYPTEGFFQATKISGYYETFLNPVTSLTSTAGMFRNCTSLVHCYYYDGSEVKERNNSISRDLFINNPNNAYMQNMFTGCSGLVGHIPPNLFTPCKSRLTNVSAMFQGCSKLNGIDLDATGDETFTGINSNWFKGCNSLVNTSSFIRDCTSMAGEIGEDLFIDCPNLAYVNNMFYNCTLMTGNIPRGLFDSCRNSLNNTSYMFYNCKGLAGSIPVGEYETIPGIVGYNICKSTDEGALQVVEVMEDPFTQVSYADVVTLSPGLATQLNYTGSYYVLPVEGDIFKVNKLGLLAECPKLTTIEGMFYFCTNLTGAIPYDLLFTRDQSIKYEKLTNVAYLFCRCQKLNEVYYDVNTEMNYLCDPILFDKCPNITNFNSTFYDLRSLPTCTIQPHMFDKQTKVNSIHSMFMGTTNLTGPISALLFRNAVTTLTDARRAFAYTKMSSVEQGFLNNGVANVKLKYVQGIFYNCSSLTGASPKFWDGSRFVVLDGTDAGIGGALYNCKQLSNYAEAQAKSEKWVYAQEIYIG